MRGLIRVAAVLTAALVVSAVGAASAFGSTGRIVNTWANADWTVGSLVGTVEWTGCANPAPKPFGPSGEYVSCAWTAYVTAGPGTAECLSPERRLTDLGPGEQLVWQGERSTGNASVAFEVNNFPLEAGKLLCLETAEETTDGTEIPCAPPGEPIPPGWHCPYVMTTYFNALDSLVLSRPAPLPPCLCPPTRPRRRHHHHVKHRRHRHIFVSQHQKVPEA